MVVALAVGVATAGQKEKSRSFTFASWSIGHFALGRSHTSTIQMAAAEAKSREFRAFLSEVNACRTEYRTHRQEIIW